MRHTKMKLTDIQKEWNKKMEQKQNCEHKFRDLYSDDKMVVMECTKPECGYKKTVLKRKK